MLIGLVALAILAVEGLPRLNNGELPTKFDALLLALATPAMNLIGKLGLGGKAPF